MGDDVTLFPVSTDPVSALSRADGTTEAHSVDHGHVIETAENVLGHGAKGDGVTDDTLAFQSTLDSGRAVYVPPGRNYIISDQLEVSNTTGLHMFGSHAGTGARIKCNGFPAATDVIKLPDTAYPQLCLENLFFESEDNSPRDFFRLSNSTDQSLVWRNVWIQGMGGRGLNVPSPQQLVTARFNNVHFIQNLGMGTFINSCTATSFRDCRWTGNGEERDLQIDQGIGVVLDHPIFDAYWPGSGNFIRAQLDLDGATILNPYFEWSTTASSGSLKNIDLTGSNIALMGGSGDVIPASGGFTLIGLDIDNVSNLTLLQPPIANWGGSTYSLSITNSDGVLAHVSDTASKVYIDEATGWSSVIYVSGIYHKGARVNGITLSGSTDDIEGYTYGLLNNGGATNMTNLTGGQSGYFVTLIAVNGNTTLMHKAGGTGDFDLIGGANVTLGADRSVQLFWRNSQWHEIGHP